jgi:lipopolysaccharide/colanic/teichoic acid biosynthesis glycosyltransferase
LKDDPRILPIGKFLRKTKINELPQLINVLTGQMSIVGYRPLVQWSYEQYPERIKEKILTLNPGLSSLASIILRDEEEIIQNIENKTFFYRNVIMPYKGEIEYWFADNYTIINYFKVILTTILVILKPKSKIWQTMFRGSPKVPHEINAML